MFFFARPKKNQKRRWGFRIPPDPLNDQGLRPLDPGKTKGGDEGIRGCGPWYPGGGTKGGDEGIRGCGPWNPGGGTKGSGAAVYGFVGFRDIWRCNERYIAMYYNGHSKV
ncbi:MAG: hypothetical protein FWH01_17125 [Oscillospiraceae bacterium]|nr:hypothetical protein [Oscillospiraceae bacterium]